MGNNTVINVASVGDVCLKPMMDLSWFSEMLNMFQIFCMNFISVGKLDDEGFCNAFKDGKWKLIEVVWLQ